LVIREKRPFSVGVLHRLALWHGVALPQNEAIGLPQICKTAACLNSKEIPRHRRGVDMIKMGKADVNNSHPSLTNNPISKTA
jgi:hypothetical protein